MILEAMAAGKAVVVTDSGGLPELVEHGRCGEIVPPLEPDTLGVVLERLIRDAQSRLRLGQAAREAARMDHNPAWVRAAWMDVLEQAMRKKNVQKIAKRVITGPGAGRSGAVEGGPLRVGSIHPS
jgi:glycosyltransferase involved in cell wall biosynthesis